MKKGVKLILLLAGTGVALHLFGQHAAAVREALSRVGWGFLWFMAASFLVYALDAWAWRLVFGKGQPAVSFGRLFSVRMAGEAVNRITPLASMGGEPLKAYLLQRDGWDLSSALASVAVAKNIMTLAQIAFIFLGIALALAHLPAQTGLFLGFGAFPGVILTAIFVTATIDFRLRRWKGKLSGWDARPRKKWQQSVLDLWAQVADFFWDHPKATLASFVLFFLGWAAGALELMAAAYALRIPLSIEQAIMFEALLVSINMATFFIPANAGSQEGGFAFLAPLLGLPPHGLAMAVLRRCRDAIWILFGVGYLSLTEGRILVRPRQETAG